MWKQKRTLSSLLLALVLAAGAAVVWGFACGIAWEGLALRLQRASRYDDLMVDVAGSPAIVTTSVTDYNIRSARTVDGEPRGVVDALQGARLAGPLRGGWLGSPQNRSWRMRISSATDGRLPPEYWYLISSDWPENLAWLEGFDSETRRRIGYLGRHGFSAEKPSPEACFPLAGLPPYTGGLAAGTRLSFASEPAYGEEPPEGSRRIPQSKIFLVSAGNLLAIDLRERGVQVLQDQGDLISVAILEQAVPSDQAKREGLLPQLVAARSADRIWIVDPATGDQRSYPLPEGLRGSSLVVHDLVDQLLLWADRGVPADGRWVLYWLDTQGKIRRERAVTLARHSNVLNDTWLERVAMLVTVPIPLLLGIAAFVIQPLVDLDSGGAASYVDALAASCAEHGIAAVLVALAAGALAAWCFFRHRRLGQPAAWVWFMFVLLLGLPGLAGYLLHRRWPICGDCPACQRRVPRDREECSACGVPFPAPAATGWEIFG